MDKLTDNPVCTVAQKEVVLLVKLLAIKRVSQKLSKGLLMVQARFSSKSLPVVTLTVLGNSEIF